MKSQVMFCAILGPDLETVLLKGIMLGDQM